LGSREEGCKWVTHQAVSGTDVVVREEGCWAVFEEDLLVGVWEVRRQRHGDR
jgi:hypothetical protein